MSELARSVCCGRGEGRGLGTLGRSPKAKTIAVTIQVLACWAGMAYAQSTSSIRITPAKVSVTAGHQQAFSAAGSHTAAGLSWAVQGVVGGNSIWGTISTAGNYTAPAISPGTTVTVSATSTSNSNLSGQATVTVVNPPIPNLTGVTYADELASWETVLLPLVQNLSGLLWNASSGTWSPIPNWAPPSQGIGPQIYYLEMYLRPATRMAIARQDTTLMDELAGFHLAMLQWRTTTVGQMIQNLGSNAVVFISGPSSARTFAWYNPYSNSTLVEVQDDVQANAQYLSQAAQLLRAIAKMPAAQRPAPLTEFAQGFSGFLVSEQLLRLMYGSTPWSHYQNANIPQPVVSAWQFLAQTGYEPPDPIKYQAAMSDTELWLVADSAEVLGADAAAPQLGILNSTTRSRLQQAVQAGVSLLQARSHHTTAPDGSDVLSLFAGDYDDYPSLAYSGDTGQALPTTPNPKTGLSWDISHSYRFPIVFRSLYETQSATGTNFPALNDVVALANTYVHLAFTGNSKLPAFSNFVDGWNGWFDVGDSSIAGYPPEQYCDATQSPINCLTAGAIQGWGQLSFANPSLATLMQDLINLAFDTSAADQPFMNQHYYYDDGPYVVSENLYPWLMIWVAGDNAERLP